MIFASITLNIIFALMIFFLVRKYQKIIKALLSEQDKENEHNAARLMFIHNEIQRVNKAETMMNSISPLAFAKKIKGKSN